MISDARNQIDAIRTRADLAAFVHALYQDYCGNPESWENNTLDAFLEALSAWVADMDGYYINNHKPIPQEPEWKTFAEIVMAATMYE